MGTTKEVLQLMNRRPGVSYPLLVPNTKGLEALLALRDVDEAATPRKPLDEIAIFTAASDSFSKANTNNSVKDSLRTLQEVAREARDMGIKVRGYVSTVISCPFEGPIAPSNVADVAKELFEIGCYEVSLGDTIGTGTTSTVVALLNEMAHRGLPLDKMAVSDASFFPWASGIGTDNHSTGSCTFNLITRTPQPNGSTT
jgi:hydroxymethylglutaryl-CoA lyase